MPLCPDCKDDTMMVRTAFRKDEKREEKVCDECGKSF